MRPESAVSLPHATTVRLDLQRASYFFCHIPRLVISEMMPAPQFRSFGDQTFESFARFRFSRWSTHKGLFLALKVRQNKARCTKYFALWVFYEMLYSAAQFHNKEPSHASDEDLEQRRAGGLRVTADVQQRGAQTQLRLSGGDRADRRRPAHTHQSTLFPTQLRIFQSDPSILLYPYLPPTRYQLRG